MSAVRKAIGNHEGWRPGAGRLCLGALAAFVVLALMAGCGGGDDGETTVGAAGAAAEGDGEAPQGNGQEGAEGGSTGSSEGAGAGGAGGSDGAGEGSGGGKGGSATKKGNGTGGRAGIGGGQGKGGKSKKGNKSQGGGSAGGGGGGGQPEDPFVAEVNEICNDHGSKMRKKVETTVASAGGIGTLKEKANLPKKLVNEIVVPGLEAEVEELRGLNPPAKHSDSTSALIDALENAIDESQADPEAATKGETFVKSKQVAAEGGFNRCGAI